MKFTTAFVFMLTATASAFAPTPFMTNRNTQLPMSLKDDIANIGKAALAGAFAVTIAAAPAHAYALVNIQNNTPFPAKGTVAYSTLLCSNDSYTVNSKGVWNASHRGACFVEGVYATVLDPKGAVGATPYSSAGTAYAAFQITPNGSGGYVVNRP